MIAKTSTKNQHYVPQFLLKKFSLDKKMIKIYQKEKDKIIEKAPIKNQCSKDWFYGKENIEEELSQIEGDGAKVIKFIIEGKKIKEIEIEQLYQFIFLQSIRTNKKKEIINNSVEEVLEEIKIYEKQSLEIIPGELIKNLKYEYKEILDLDFIILKIKDSEEDNEFVISDNPVVNYNYCYKRFNAGYAKTGTTLIMPLTPYETIMLYDKNTYELSNINENKIMYIDEDEVKKLNNLQYINSDKNIYFKKKLDKYREEVQKISIKKKSSVTRIGKDQQIVNMNLDDIEFIDVSLKFLKISEEEMEIKKALLERLRLLEKHRQITDIKEYLYPLFQRPRKLKISSDEIRKTTEKLKNEKP